MESITSALENVAADKGRICGSLHYIRTNFTNRIEGINELRDHGGIKILVKCLKQVNPKVLSLTLSILGNCSLNETCREQLFEYGVIKDLAFIMKNINVDAIDNRTCRMIANLAESQIHIPIMFKHNIPSTVLNILSKTKCDGTRYSAIRALRKIWENSSKSGCSEILKYQAVRVVSELLTSSSKDVVIAVLRAQTSFLTNATNLKHPSNNYNVVTQILGEDALCVNTMNNMMNLLPEQPLIGKIVYSMSKVSHARMLLKKSGLMTHIIEALRNENNHFLIVSMCLLCECPHNRDALINTENGIDVLLSLIRCTNPIQKDLAMNALINFQFNKKSLSRMAQKGLIVMLIRNLSLYIQSNKCYFPCHSNEKLPKPSSNITLCVCCTSPAGSSGMSPSSPTARSFTPPINENITTEPYSPYYSPVCESFDNESINADESKSDVSDYEIEADKDAETPDKSAEDSVIIYLLTIMSYVENVSKIMVAKEIWETILDFMRYILDGINNLKTIKLLQTVIKEVENFRTIVSEGLILSAHQKLCRPDHDFKSCQTCDIRNMLGQRTLEIASHTFESNFAVDVLISIMKEPPTSTDNENLKKIVSVTIPLVQTRPRLLCEMLFRYKAYDYICDIIKDENSPLFDHSVGALIALFQTSNVTFKKSTIKCCEDRNCIKNILKKETTVTLAFDDGTLINANKSFLSLKSPMFEAMFRDGGFKEAYQKTIRLNDVSPECFKSLLHLLEVCCDCLLPNNINQLLELIMVTDRFMLNELSEKINTIMMNSILSPNNCSAVYEWAKEIGYQLKFGTNTSSYVVKYLLSSNSRFPDRVEAIKQISRSNYVQNFIEDFSAVLKFGFTSKCGDDKIVEFYLSKLCS